METTPRACPSPALPLWKRLDPPTAAIAILAIALALWAPEHLGSSAGFVIRAGLGVLPFLLAAILAAAWIEAAGATHLVAKAFTGHPIRMIVAGTLIGALSPFCSCGVIPIIVALLASGVPLAPVMAFWLASPIMDPALFLVTAGTLGLEFAIAKTLAAIAIGLFGGIGAWALAHIGRIGTPLRPDLSRCGCNAHPSPGQATVRWTFWREAPRIDVFRTTLASMAWFLGRWMTLAFLLESLMVSHVPAELVADMAGGTGALSILNATLIGIPAYLNGYAALPLVAGLMTQGMSAPAAMGFLLGGGVTSIPAALAVWAATRPQVFGIYLLFALTGSIMSAFVFGLWSR